MSRSDDTTRQSSARESTLSVNNDGSALGIHPALGRKRSPMSRTAVLVLLALCLGAPAVAQAPNVSGIVIDDRTEQPIRGVLIYVEGQSSFTETDGTGRFRVTVSRGKQKITASVIGYALLSTDVEVADAPLEMTIRLSEGAGAYTERVTVSGSLRGESDAVPGST